jgi:hypothetical protein
MHETISAHPIGSPAQPALLLVIGHHAIRLTAGEAAYLVTQIHRAFRAGLPLWLDDPPARPSSSGTQTGSPQNHPCGACNPSSKGV